MMGVQFKRMGVLGDEDGAGEARTVIVPRACLRGKLWTGEKSGEGVLSQLWL